MMYLLERNCKLVMVELGLDPPILCGSRPYFQMWQLFFALLRDSVYSRQGLLHLPLVRSKGIRCLSVH